MSSTYLESWIIVLVLLAVICIAMVACPWSPVVLKWRIDELEKRVAEERVQNGMTRQALAPLTQHIKICPDNQRVLISGKQWNGGECDDPDPQYGYLKLEKNPSGDGFMIFDHGLVTTPQLLRQNSAKPCSANIVGSGNSASMECSEVKRK